MGRPLVRRLFDLKANVYTMSRNEGAIFSLQEEFPGIGCYLADISDEYEVDRILGHPDFIHGVFHLAAMKSVGRAEEQPYACCKTNIVGTINLLESSYDLDFFLGISTDKAAQMNGVYGASKYIMEKLVWEMHESNPTTKYRIVRYGNVLYSTGSVLCKWKDKLQKGEEIIVTDLNATRFFWTVDQAIDLIFECLDKATDAAPYIPQMKAMRVGDLLQVMMNKYGGPNPKFKVIGLQAGENMHETMDGKIFSNQIELYSPEEIYKLV